MAEQEFHRAVSRDSAPRESQCEWCGKPAVVRLTAIGGPAHNASGLFCRTCGEAFVKAIARETDGGRCSQLGRSTRWR